MLVSEVQVDALYGGDACDAIGRRIGKRIGKRIGEDRMGEGG